MTCVDEPTADTVFAHRPTMSSSYPILPSRPLQPHIHTTCSQCGSQLEFPVPVPLPRPSTLLHIRCFQCQSVISHAFYPTQVPVFAASNSPSGGSGSDSVNANGRKTNATQSARKGRKIGTQERPLETGYYDILGIPVTATTDDVKKAYRESQCDFVFAYSSSSSWLLPLLQDV